MMIWVTVDEFGHDMMMIIRYDSPDDKETTFAGW